MKNIVVFTCITNNYDWLLPPLWTSPNVIYICFSDDPNLRCKGWEVRPLPSLPVLRDGNLANRFCKFFPWKILPAHKWSLYIDANIRLLIDPSPIITEALGIGAEIAIPNHPQRSDLWEEAGACKKLNKFTASDFAAIDAQLGRYESSGMPKGTGLTGNGIIFRSGQSERLLPVMEKWWIELSEGVKRDQISLPFVLWSTDVPIYKIPFFVWDPNPYFRIVPHRRGSGWFSYLHARQYHGSVYSVSFSILNLVRRLAAVIFRALPRIG